MSADFGADSSSHFPGSRTHMVEELTHVPNAWRQTDRQTTLRVTSVATGHSCALHRPTGDAV